MDVAKIAKLARLQLNDTEAKAIEKDLESILAYAKDLESLDLKDVPPTSHAVLTQAPMREDVPAPSLSFDKLSPPEKEGTAFRVPKVIE